MRILAINPGSTSTKIAVYDDGECIFQEAVLHTDAELGRFNRVVDQFEYRVGAIVKTLAGRGYSLGDFSALAARGGLLRPLAGGVYLVDREMCSDLEQCRYGEHSSNLGAVIAGSISEKYGIPAYIVDPVTVDELHDLARYSGLPDLPRTSKSHALNMRAVAREAAAAKDMSIKSVNLVVAHLGSGISVAAFENGRMIDVNNANNEGPFSIERCGGLPSLELVEMCFSGKYTREQMVAKVIKTGGVYAYTGTRDFRRVEEMAASGQGEALQVVRAMCYQVAKEIGAMSAALRGRVDAVVLTGGMAHSGLVVDEIKDRVSSVAEIMVIPGEKEMEALAFGVQRVLEGREEARHYGTGEEVVRGEKND